MKTIKTFDNFVNESADEDKYLTTKQKKLPEGLKKGIIAKAKKAGGKKDEDEKEEKDKKDCKCKDDKKDDKCDCKDKKEEKDEDNGLSAKQKKLPKALQDAILKKKKKKK